MKKINKVHQRGENHATPTPLTKEINYHPTIYKLTEWIKKFTLGR